MDFVEPMFGQCVMLVTHIDVLKRTKTINFQEDLEILWHASKLERVHKELPSFYIL